MRSFVCRGSSMLIIDPKNSSTSGGQSGMLEPAAMNSSGVAAHVHDVGVADDRPEAGPDLDPGVVERRFGVPRHRALAPGAGRTRPPCRPRAGPRTRPARGRSRRAARSVVGVGTFADATAAPSRPRASSATIASSVRVMGTRRLEPPAGHDPVGAGRASTSRASGRPRRAPNSSSWRCASGASASPRRARSANFARSSVRTSRG